MSASRRHVGSRGDSYDNALAESVMGLFKTEVIRRLGPWRSLEAVEFETLAWVDWFNGRRLLEPIGYVPPAEYEAQTISRPHWPESTNSLSQKLGTVQLLAVPIMAAAKAVCEWIDDLSSYAELLKE